MGKTIVSSSALTQCLVTQYRRVLCNVYKMLFVFSGLHGYFVRVAVFLTVLQHAGETLSAQLNYPSCGSFT